MALPEIVDRDQWRAARIELLTEEKATTQARDALSSKRREMPMVQVDKDYRFEGPDGSVPFIDLFEGRRQLIVQHFMFDPTWEDGCSSCTAACDELCDGLLEHLHVRDTTLAVVARAPLATIERYRAKRGWTFPWYSSFGSDFNYDYHVTLDARVSPVEFNFRTASELATKGWDWMLDGSSEQPGYSIFLQVEAQIFHTNSVFARGTEWLGGSYAFLDLTALGRQEDWELPQGRSGVVRGAVPNFSN